MSDIILVLKGNYGNNENVEWTIVVPDGQVVRLIFDTFHTYGGTLSNGREWGDFVRVYDGCTTGDPSIGNYSGGNILHDNIPGSILSTGNVLHITFTSDGGTTRLGFSATASGVDLAGNDNITDILQTVADITLHCDSLVMD